MRIITCCGKFWWTEWGFDGYVVSDWGASNDHAAGVENGSHLEMAGNRKMWHARHCARRTKRNLKGRGLGPAP